MQKLMKRPLKIIAAASFMVALGYGVATNSEVSESGKTSNLNLSALSSVSAQGETGFPGVSCKCRRPLFRSWRCVSNGTRGSGCNASNSCQDWNSNCG